MIRDWCLFEYQYDSKMYYVGKIITVSDKKSTADFLQFMLEGNDNEHAKFLEKPNAICEADHDQIVLDNPVTRERDKNVRMLICNFCLTLVHIDWENKD